MIPIDSRSTCATAASSFCRHSRHWQTVWQMWDTRRRIARSERTPRRGPEQRRGAPGLPAYYRAYRLRYAFTSLGGVYPRRPPASRTSVIASDHPMFRGHIEDGESALIFTAARPRALANAIARLMTDPTLYARVSNGSARAWLAGHTLA